VLHNRKERNRKKMEITIEITPTPYEQLGTAYKRLGEIMAELNPKQTRYDEIKELAKEAKGLKVDIKPLAKEAKKVKKDIKRLSKMVQEPRKPRKAKDTNVSAEPTPESTQEPSGAQTSESPDIATASCAICGTEGVPLLPCAIHSRMECGICIQEESLHSIRENTPATDPAYAVPGKPSEPITAPRKGHKGKKSEGPTLAELKAAALASAECKMCNQPLKSCKCGK
jgi:hypothetical protein